MRGGGSRRRGPALGRQRRCRFGDRGPRCGKRVGRDQQTKRKEVTCHVVGVCTDGLCSRRFRMGGPIIDCTRQSICLSRTDAEIPVASKVEENDLAVAATGPNVWGQSKTLSDRRVIHACSPMGPSRTSCRSGGDGCVKTGRHVFGTSGVGSQAVFAGCREAPDARCASARCHRSGLRSAHDVRVVFEVDGRGVAFRHLLGIAQVDDVRWRS